jgi:dCMP deaminase
MIPDWDHYFLGIADAVSKRGSCPRLQVGAVLVQERHIVACGYNGSIHGQASCLDEGCLLEHDHCVRTIHAEVNALIHAARMGSAGVQGSTLYANWGPPCWNCFRVLANAGVSRYVYENGYKPDFKVESIAWDMGLELIQLRKGARLP